jgi:hypothetical protein
MKALSKLAAVLSAGLLSSVAYAQCPNIGAANGCTTIITVDSSGSLTAAAGPSTSPTYDGADDQLVGFFNNSLASIGSITLNGNGTNIFGFDGDGIDSSGFNAPGNSMDNTGYGGPDAYFTNYLTDPTMGTVNFVTPIAPGGFTYFSLEEPFTTGSITGTPGGGSGATPEPSTFLLLGTGIAGLVGTLRRRLLS